MEKSQKGNLNSLYLKTACSYMIIPIMNNSGLNRSYAGKHNL